MRESRRGLLAVVSVMSVMCVAAAPAAQAQQEHLFQNSWFWGVHAGGASIGTPASSKVAATFGADWFITRSRGGLYVAFDQANFNRVSSVPDASVPSGARGVAIHDLRTVSVAAMAFPYESNGFRPYAGLGYGLSVLGSAVVQPDASGAAITSDVAAAAENGRSHAAPFVIGGAQLQLNRAAIFGQVTAASGAGDFLVTRALTTFTVGVRYNFGSAVEQ